MIATASQLTAGAHAAVVYNPAKISIDRVRPAVTAQQRSHGWEETRWFETASEDSGRCAAEQALAGEPTVVIVVGGDGTVRA
ncbi:diacylglycerol kinase family protein, partial [Salmonella enterica]